VRGEDFWIWIIRQTTAPQEFAAMAPQEFAAAALPLIRRDGWQLFATQAYVSAIRASDEAKGASGCKDPAAENSKSREKDSVLKNSTRACLLLKYASNLA